VLDLTDIRAALFDLDGTLVRTFIDFPAMRRAMHALSAKWGTESSTAGSDDILEIVERMAGALGKERGEVARREAHALLGEMEEAGCAHPEPIAGASDLLRRLRHRRGVRVAVITRNSRRVAEDLLNRMDLEHDLLVARGDTPEHKPHPAPLLYACAHLGVAPSDAVMIGDLWADIAAGRAAGVRFTIGIHWPHDPPDRFARCPPDQEVTSLEAAADLLTSPRHLVFLPCDG
jgi:phosphoglycolate phosphatase